MKKDLTIVLLCFIIFFTSNAQTQIAAGERTDGVWSELRNEWDIVSKDNESTTYFEFNDNFKFLTHKTPSSVSIYKLNLQKYDSKYQYFNFDAVSDSGHTYTMVVDYEKKLIRFTYKDEYEKTRLVQHNIKKLTFME